MSPATLVQIKALFTAFPTTFLATRFTTLVELLLTVLGRLTP